MNTYVKFSEIPKDERKLLAQAAFRETPKLRNVMIAAMAIALVCSDSLTDAVGFKHASFLPRLGVSIITMLVLFGIIWGAFGRSQLRAEVERLKNPISPPG